MSDAPAELQGPNPDPPEVDISAEEEGPKLRNPVGRPRADGSSAPTIRKKRKYTPKKSRHGLCLPEEKLQEMFTIYCQMPNYSYVARTCNVHMASVKRYAVEQKWAERRDKIMEEARAKTDYTITDATADSLRLIKDMKEKLGKKIEELQTGEINTAFLVSDLERLVKLEQVLLGGVGDRNETVHTTHEERIRRLRERREIDVTPRPKELPSA